MKLGLFVTGPTGHFLYILLEKISAKLPFADKWKLTAVKLAISNLLISPILNTLNLLALSLIGKGSSLNDAVAFVEQRLLPTMKISWTLFPLVQLFAFKNLPPSAWLPFFNFVAFLFGTGLNIKAKLAASKKQIDDGDKKVE